MVSILALAAGVASLSAAALPGGLEAAADVAPPTVAEQRTGEELKTLKERLSDKPSDEQRVDNCGVPMERRGTKPRPDCPPGRAPTAVGMSPSPARR